MSESSCTLKLLVPDLSYDSLLLLTHTLTPTLDRYMPFLRLLFGAVVGI